MEMTDYEIREQLISQLPDLTAAFIAENGPIVTLPIMTERNTPYQCQIVRAGQGKRARRVDKTKCRHGGYRGARGPKPENVEKIRALLPLKLTRQEMCRRTGLTPPTVRTIADLLLSQGVES